MKYSHKYYFVDMNTRDLYRFARDLPNDIEASEKKALIDELASRMWEFYNQDDWDS